MAFIDLSGDSLRPPTICGAFICPNCFRDLVKSSCFLLNLQAWNHKIKNINSEYLEVGQDQGNNCVICDQKMNRKIQLECANCYLFKSILNDITYQPGNRCKVLKENIWVDIRSEEKGQMIFCNFCNFPAKKKFVFQVCEECKDTACLSCIRKNEYLSNGICTNCRYRRKVSILNN